MASGTPPASAGLRRRTAEERTPAWHRARGARKTLVLLALALAVASLLYAAGKPLASALAASEPGPTLGRATPILDPSGHALDAFHAALRRAAQGRGQARVMWWGASHVAGDNYVGFLRERLQARFGDAGPGLVLPVRPFARYHHRAASLFSAGSWRILRADHGARGAAYGFAGFAAESRGRGAFGHIDLTDTDSGARRASSLELFYLQRPTGGALELQVDGRRVLRLDTLAAREDGGYARVALSDAPHQILLRALDDRPVRVFGLALERKRPGVVIDTLGIPGSRAAHQLRFQGPLYAEQLARRRPDLTVLAYGTNESTDGGLSASHYARDLRKVLMQLRASAPGSDCLLVGPSDRPLRRADGSYAPRPRTRALIDVQRRIAEEHGCGFFDLVAFMGGPMSMLAWVEADPPYAHPDHVHFTERGHRRLAAVMEAALLKGYRDAR